MSDERVGVVQECLPSLPPSRGGLGVERGNHRGIAPTRFHNSFRRAIDEYSLDRVTKKVGDITLIHFLSKCD